MINWQHTNISSEVYSVKRRYYIQHFKIKLLNKLNLIFLKTDESTKNILGKGSKDYSVAGNSMSSIGNGMMQRLNTLTPCLF